MSTRAALELGLAERVALGDELQIALVDLIDLGLLAKQLRWTLSGAQTPRLAALLDELAHAAQQRADEVAARMLELGRVPNGHSRTVAVETRLAPLPTARIGCCDGAGQLGARLEQVDGRLERALRIACADPCTAHLIWDVRAALRGHAARIGAFAGTMRAPAG